MESENCFPRIGLYHVPSAQTQFLAHVNAFALVGVAEDCGSIVTADVHTGLGNGYVLNCHDVRASLSDQIHENPLCPTSYAELLKSGDPLLSFLH